jgi:hypothetical protein
MKIHSAVSAAELGVCLSGWVEQREVVQVDVGRRYPVWKRICWSIDRQGIGCPTRIGLEDTITGPTGEPVSDNAELVRLALATWTAARR